MTHRVTVGKATNEAELEAELKAISLDNPGKAYTALTNFGTVRIYEYVSLGRVAIDQMDTREMLRCHGGLAYVNGELRSPTAGWLKRSQAQQLRNHED